MPNLDGNNERSLRGRLCRVFRLSIHHPMLRLYYLCLGLLAVGLVAWLTLSSTMSNQKSSRRLGPDPWKYQLSGRGPGGAPTKAAVLSGRTSSTHSMTWPDAGHVSSLDDESAVVDDPNMRAPEVWVASEVAGPVVMLDEYPANPAGQSDSEEDNEDDSMGSRGGSGGREGDDVSGIAPSSQGKQGVREQSGTPNKGSTSSEPPHKQHGQAKASAKQDKAKKKRGRKNRERSMRSGGKPTDDGTVQGNSDGASKATSGHGHGSEATSAPYDVYDYIIGPLDTNGSPDCVLNEEVGGKLPVGCMLVVCVLQCNWHCTSSVGTATGSMLYAG